MFRLRGRRIGLKIEPNPVITGFGRFETALIPRRRTPKCRKHRSTGQAVVTICGKDFYLGPRRSEASIAEYDRLIAEWLAGGHRPLHVHETDDGLTITVN